MNKLLLFTLLILFGHSFGQSTEQVAVLDSNLSENSGISIVDNQIILHNDGGNSASIHSSSINNISFQECTVGMSTNTDWEDICSDDQFIFIGDFGNNSNNRQDLKIFKTAKQSVLDCNISQTEIISFNYPDQNTFPPNDNNLRFDAEAMISFNDSFYIFTKDRTNPYLGKTWVYSLPKTAGNHTAILVDSFDLNVSSLFYSITGAAISPDQSKMALINSNSIFLFSNFSNDSFFDGDLEIIPLGMTQQFEAIDFLDNETIYFSCEESILGDAKLFKLDLNSSNTQEIKASQIKIIQRKNTFEISQSSGSFQVLDIQLVNSTGLIVENQQVGLNPKETHELVTDTKSGIYVLSIQSDSFRKKLKISISD